MSRRMEGVWILTHDPSVKTDPALGHTAEGWDRAVARFEYSTSNWPEQRERAGDTDMIAIAVIETDGDTVRGRDWNGRAAVLTRVRP